MSRLYFDSPPAYQTVDPRVELSLAIASEENTQAIQIEREDTPRNRFEHHVELRQELQFDEWQHMLIDRSLFGSVESQKTIAHAWVVALWKKHGLWDSRWPETGPETEARWRLDIVPAALVVMELGSYIEHLVTTQAPTTIPCLSNSDMGRDRELESAEWPIHNLVQTVLTDKSRHWQKAGFASATMGAPRVKFYRDFASLRANLPEPARERLDSYNVQDWSGLSVKPIHKLRPRGGLFGGPMPRTDQRGNDGANGAGSSGSSGSSMTEETAQRLVQELEDRSSESPGTEEAIQVLTRELRSRTRNRTRRSSAWAASSRSTAVRPQAASSRSAAVRPQAATSRSAAIRPQAATSRSTAARPQAASSQSTAARPRGIKKKAARRKP